jgi:hypothetical protein
LSTVLLRETGVDHGDMDDGWGTVVPLRMGTSSGAR